MKNRLKGGRSGSRETNGRLIQWSRQTDGSWDKDGGGQKSMDSEYVLRWWIGLSDGLSEECEKKENKDSGINRVHSRGETWRDGGGIKDSVGFLLSLRRLKGRTLKWRWIYESGVYMSPQVLLPAALCLPLRSRLEGEASAGPR